MKTVSLEDELGDILQKARYGLGLTIQQVSDRTRINAQRLAAMEKYLEQPNDLQVESLARELDLASDKLLRIVQNRIATYHGDHQFGDLRVHCLQGHSGEAHCYIVINEHIGSCVVVDPGVSASRIYDTMDAHRLQVEAILVTHGHGDHVQSLGELKHTVGCRSFAGPLPDTRQDAVLLGEPCNVLATPGHTVDSVCYHFPGFVFVGDVLFAGSVGRASNEGWYRRHLSAGQRILELPEQTVIYPGHGPVTDVRIEKRQNPFFY